MSRTEEAWKSLEKKWGLDGPVYADGNLEMVKHYLKRLRSYRLPLAAIEDLEELIVYLDKYYTEE